MSAKGILCQLENLLDVRLLSFVHLLLAFLLVGMNILGEGFVIVNIFFYYCKSFGHIQKKKTVFNKNPRKLNFS